MENHEFARITRIMSVTAGPFPFVILAIVSFGVWVHGFSWNSIGAGAALFCVSCLMARFFYRRARDLEAVFFTVRIRPTDSELTKVSTDCAALVSAVLILLGAFLLALVHS